MKIQYTYLNIGIWFHYKILDLYDGMNLELDWDKLLVVT